MKRCYRCKKLKSNSEFCRYRSGVNKGYLASYCKVCTMLVTKEILSKKPWLKYLGYAQHRCRKPNGKYYRIGIKMLLTKADIKHLWFRDKAMIIKRPALDRKDGKKDYTFENCRFIEFSENSHYAGLLSKGKHSIARSIAAKKRSVLRKRDSDGCYI